MKQKLSEQKQVYDELQMKYMHKRLEGGQVQSQELANPGKLPGIRGANDSATLPTPLANPDGRPPGDLAINTAEKAGDAGRSFSPDGNIPANPNLTGFQAARLTSTNFYF